MEKVSEAQREAKEQFKVTYSSIKDMLDALRDAEDDDSSNRAEEDIMEYPLDIDIERRYIILLSTGGPATRIIGLLDENSEPETAHFQYQNWFTIWTDVVQTEAEEEVLLEFARHFYFGK